MEGVNEIRKRYFELLSEIDSVELSKWYYYRDLLNDYDFNRFEYGTNRAFYKLWEILQQYPDVSLSSNKRHSNLRCPAVLDGERSSEPQVFKTCHLAEAPGSFVMAVQKAIPHAKSIALSRKPSRPVVRRGNNGSPAFHRALYNNPNVTLMYADLLEGTDFYASLGDQKFDLVTADGGLDEGEKYSRKEELHYDLIFAEVINILKLQALGGSCVIKVFETFTDETLRIMNYLIHHYTAFVIYKPLTSRPTNAERYLICKDFQGASLDQIASKRQELPPVPMEMWRRLQYHNIRITQKQTGHIRNILNAIQGKVVVNPDDRLKAKSLAFTEWCKRYKLCSE